MKPITTIIIFILFTFTYASYIPQLILTTTADFFNKQLSLNVGPKATDFINKFKAPNQTFDDKFDGVHISLNLTNITQKVDMNWNTNLINVTGNHNFSILAKNINVTINGELQFFIISKNLRQKGHLEIQVSQLQAHTSLSFIRTACPKSIGFGLFINDILVDSSKFVIQIKDKKLDNYIIRLLESLLKSRVPNIINTKVRDAVNDAVEKATCNGIIQQVVPVGHQTYVLSINTTDVPYFANRQILTIPLDINFQNQKTNATNEQVDNQNLVEEHVYQKQANVTMSLSSNMLDTILWLVDDSNILSFAVNKEQLGPNAPISLDTSGLAIILPGLKKFPNKDVIVRVNTSSEFSEVFIRSGRFLSAMSVSADFIINDTGRVTDLDKCLQKRQCFVATTLNITLGVSASVRAQKFNHWSGLIQSLYIHQIKVIQPSLIEVKIQNLMKILNPLISSARPQINKSLQQGFTFDPSTIEQLKKFNLTGVIGQKFLDYASFGLKFDI